MYNINKNFKNSRQYIIHLELTCPAINACINTMLSTIKSWEVLTEVTSKTHEQLVHQ